MERQGRDYAAASPAYAQQQRQPVNMQQQQQYGFHPQPQQFPSSVHGPPFLPPGPGHPPMQQFPYPHIMQQQQLQQLHPHGPPPPHLLQQHRCDSCVPLLAHERGARERIHFSFGNCTQVFRGLARIRRDGGQSRPDYRLIVLSGRSM